MLEQTQTPLNLQTLHQSQFGALTESHRSELRVHCYRMLGSIQEAEELVQETFLRAWHRRETYQGRSSLRAWLYRIATNLCIDALRKRPRRSLPIAREAQSNLEQPIPPSIHEPIWLEPYPFDLAAPNESNPEARYSLNESIQLAFLIAIHLLPPRQRAVLILRDVLDWHTDEIADALEQTIPSVKSALHRARTTLDKHRQTLHLEDVNPRLSDDDLLAKLELYLHAWHSANVAELLSLLKADATFSMPPVPSWYRGREDIGKLVSQTIFSGSNHWRLIPTRANAQTAFGVYRRNDDGKYDGYGIQVVTFTAGQIADITTFRVPALIQLFNLPTTLSNP